MSRIVSLALMLLLLAVACSTASASDTLVLAVPDRTIWPGKHSELVTMECVGIDDPGNYNWFVLIDGFPRSITVAKTDQPASKSPPPADSITGRVAGNRLLVSLPRSLLPAAGAVKIVVKAGDHSSAEETVYIASLHQIWLLVISAGATAVIGLLVLCLVNEARKSFTPTLDLSKLLLIDPESGSISLSKFQLCIWLVVGAFTFVYLFCIGVSVRGVAEMPLIDTLYVVIGGSAATGVIASGISSSRGPKGAGSFHPRISELITSGGVVAADRLQFFVWTILAATVYWLVVVFSEPARLVAAPEIPNSLLLFFGASSAGYLSGKAVRGPGPVILSATANNGSTWPQSNPITIHLVGRNLGLKAMFELDGKPLAVGPEGGPTVSVKTYEEERPEFARDLTLTIPSAPPATGSAHVMLKVINPDGQFAAWNFDKSAK